MFNVLCLLFLTLYFLSSAVLPLFIYFLPLKLYISVAPSFVLCRLPFPIRNSWIDKKGFIYSVMQSDGNSFCGDSVPDSFNKTSRDEDKI